MPNRPNTPCRHPGCAALVPYGTKYCDRHKPLHPEEVRSAAGRGYGRAESTQALPGGAHLVCRVHEGGQVRQGDRRRPHHPSPRRQEALLGRGQLLWLIFVQNMTRNYAEWNTTGWASFLFSAKQNRRIAPAAVIIACLGECNQEM